MGYSVGITKFFASYHGMSHTI
ncbi:unnamed protein product [Acanthoscelides obtectus]|uniref:Uncharacterized protein n=1 Tax=Acanthoscelides obtectus TaxID=200917 RepID=A0A9P0JVF0_ACAOB|nr:unnamed protein product [Acanthoscelides obtectus]CAK1628052.1 hypothetical protein AOBTE_LOCUS4985 [Acanthoscelides obtectus]